MAQTIQLFGTIVHRPKLIVLDEPFSGLDAINQGRLEHLIREEAAEGATIIFSTHVIAHAERLCERVAIIAGGRIRFEGSVAEARERLRPQVRSEEHTSELQSLMRISYAVFCLKKKKQVTCPIRTNITATSHTCNTL